jgi:hypothetical protein
MTKLLYGMAYNVTRNLFVPGYEKDDLIQECVTEALEIIQVGFQNWMPPKAYIAQSMRFHVYHLIHDSQKVSITYSTDIIELFHVPLHNPIQIPIPLSNSLARHTILILLENDMSVRKAAQSLHLPYETFRKRWGRTKRLLTSGIKTESLLNEETMRLIRKEIYERGYDDSNHSGAISAVGYKENNLSLGVI